MTGEKNVRARPNAKSKDKQNNKILAGFASISSSMMMHDAVSSTENVPVVKWPIVGEASGATKSPAIKIQNKHWRKQWASITADVIPSNYYLRTQKDGDGTQWSMETDRQTDRRTKPNGKNKIRSNNVSVVSGTIKHTTAQWPFAVVDASAPPTRSL